MAPSRFAGDRTRPGHVVRRVPQRGRPPRAEAVRVELATECPVDVGDGVAPTWSFRHQRDEGDLLVKWGRAQFSSAATVRIAQLHSGPTLSWDRRSQTISFIFRVARPSSKSRWMSASMSALKIWRAAENESRSRERFCLWMIRRCSRAYLPGGGQHGALNVFDFLVVVTHD